jgi:hypothetical protein
MHPAMHAWASTPPPLPWVPSKPRKARAANVQPLCPPPSFLLTTAEEEEEQEAEKPAASGKKQKKEKKGGQAAAATAVVEAEEEKAPAAKEVKAKKPKQQAEAPVEIAEVGDLELAKKGKPIVKKLYTEHKEVTAITTQEVRGR